MASVRVEYSKWPGTRHWHYEMVELGRDRYGMWLALPPGGIVQRGDEPGMRRDPGFVKLVPERGWWTAIWNVAPRTYEIYCDVATPPVVESGVLEMIDLDLDVVRYVDGSTAILDEDEFADHITAFGYPDRIVDRVRSTTAELFESIDARREPFGVTGPEWLGRYRDRFTR